MIRQQKTIAIFFLFFPLLLQATDEQMLSLDTVNVCKFTLDYQDKGSGGDKDVAIYTPHVPGGFYMIGGYAQGNYNRPNQCVIAVKPSDSNVNQTTPLLMKPANWRLVWVDKGSGANMDGSIWQPVTAHEDYICVGSVGQTGYHPPPISNYRCLHKCLLQSVNVPGFIWSDRGTHADKPVSMYKLANSNSFTARPNRNKPSLLIDLQPSLVCSNNLEPILNTSTMNKEVETFQPPPPPRKSNEWVNPDKVYEPPARTSPPPNSEWINPDDL